MAKAGVKIVSGYIPLYSSYRSDSEYRRLGAQLRAAVPNATIYENETLDQCWMSKFLNRHADVKPQVGDNPAKNTISYHTVQHQKVDWMRRAFTADPYQNVYVWIDYAVFHMPGVTEDVIHAFIERAQEATAIAIPGCWAEHIAFDSSPNWRFCGSVLVCPREHVCKLDFEIKEEARRNTIDTGRVTWEVNTWARVEATTKLPIRWYQADHNASLFTNYEAPHDAAS